MPEEKQLTEQESLQLIGRMIHEAKGYYYESGLGGLIYGFSFFICSLLHYLMGKELIAFPFEPFYLLVPVFFAQAWLQWNEEKKKKAKTFTDEAVDYVWMGFFISALAAWCGAFAGLQYSIVTIIIFLMAFAAYVTGSLTKFRYHIIAAFICWALAIASFFMQDPGVYLLLALAAVLVWIVPGFILNAHFRKQHP
jgi:hypothetical protein